MIGYSAALKPVERLHEVDVSEETDAELPIDLDETRRIVLVEQEESRIRHHESGHGRWEPRFELVAAVDGQHRTNLLWGNITRDGLDMPVGEQNQEAPVLGRQTEAG